MTYAPRPFPFKSMSMLGLQSWIAQELDAIASAMPARRVLDADQLATLPWDSGQDATPAIEQLLAKVPDGAHLIFSRPGTLTLKQPWVPTARRSVTIGGLWDPRYVPNATTFQWAPSQNGGHAISLVGCNLTGFEQLAFIGGDEDSLIEFDRNAGVVSGSRCFLRRCWLEARTHRAGHTLLGISRTASANQEWHTIQECRFNGLQEIFMFGGRYDASNAGNVVAGSDRLTINGPLQGPGHNPAWFTDLPATAVIGATVLVAVASVLPDGTLVDDGRRQFRTTIAEILDQRTARLADPAPVTSANCYCSVTTASSAGIFVGQSANALKHRFIECQLSNLGTGIQSTGGSFQAEDCKYVANVRNIECDGDQIEPSSDERPTCENSMQHLFLWTPNSFQIKGPGRLALSTPMPGAPFIAFGTGVGAYECDHVSFQDRDLPKGSTIYDLTRAYTPDNQPAMIPDSQGTPRGVTTNAQMLLRMNNYWHPEVTIGLQRPFTGISYVRRLMETSTDHGTRDEIITAAGILAA